MDVQDNFYMNIIESVTDGVYLVDRERRIKFWNQGAEHITGYPASDMLESFCSDNKLIHVDADGSSLCKESCPLAHTIVDGRFRENIVYLHHKEGHRVPVLIRVKPIRDKEGKIIGAVELFTERYSSNDYMERIKQLEEKAFIDFLTGLANRQYINKKLESRLGEFQRYGWSFGMLMMDIDHFKVVNDTYGHPVGDQVLKVVAKTLLLTSRTFDMIGRWGGEEFIGILTNLNTKKLYKIAERMRILVAESNFNLDNNILNVTISIGATLVLSNDTIESLIKRADDLLYQSKQNGRNRVTLG